MVIVHHTACDLLPAVATFLSEKGPHYMIDADGQMTCALCYARADRNLGEIADIMCLNCNGVAGPINSDPKGDAIVDFSFDIVLRPGISQGRSHRIASHVKTNSLLKSF